MIPSAYFISCGFSHLVSFLGSLILFWSLLQKFIEHDFLLEKLSDEVPIYIILEGSEPPFFTRFFTWDSAKSNVCGFSCHKVITITLNSAMGLFIYFFFWVQMHGNSFQRKLSIVKNGGTPIVDVRFL